MSHKRILVAQGPSQLISALAVWEYLASAAPAQENSWEDILVLGAFCVPDKIGRELERICRQIARTWNFTSIISARGHDAAFTNGRISFERYIENLAAEVGVGAVQEVYVSRNMQPLNEAALFAWPMAKKICYGDLGIIDLNGAPWSKPLKESGYPQVDAIMSHAPVERTPGIFAQYPVTCIPVACFLSAWSKASQAVWGVQALCRELSKDCGPKKILLCPTNFTEGGNVQSVEQELQFHEACLAPYIEKDSTIFIKGHPRETLKQACLLTARLCSKGYDARCFPGFNTVSVDLFAPFLRVDVLLSLFSHSGVFWRLAQPETDLVIGVPEDLVQKFIWPAAQEMYRYNEVAALYYLLSIMSTRREYRPVRTSSLLQCLHLVPAQPILLKGQTGASEGVLDPSAAKFYETVMRTEEQARVPL